MKKEDIWKEVDGALKHFVVDGALTCDTSTDGRLRAALTRRGISMHVGRLLSYEVHDEYVCWLLREMDRPGPKGYSSTSLDQVHTCDVEMFMMAAELTEESLELAPTGEYPLDAIWKQLMISPKRVVQQKENGLNLKFNYNEVL